MFDRIINVRGDGEHHHFHRSEVHEHRAPTDKSVELLREMEKAALDKLLASVRLEGCEVSCVVHQWRDIAGMQRRYIVQYQLGSKRHEVKHTFIERGVTDQKEKERLIAELLEAVSRDIAINLLGPPLGKAMHNF